MPSNDPHILVADNCINLKFDRTLSVSCLQNQNFIVTFSGATPYVVDSPFMPINIAEDYNSISRVLTLYYNVHTNGITVSSSYLLTVNNLVDAAGNPVAQLNYVFDTNPTVLNEGPPPADPIYVEDHSVRTDLYTDFDQIIEVNPNFYVVATDPDMMDPIVDPGYNNGRITITFSQTPNGVYLNSQYFRVQCQPLRRGLSRWLAVPNTIISLDAQQPKVYIDVPSQDATPIYNTPGAIYYLTGYKYRVKITKDVGT